MNRFGQSVFGYRLMMFILFVGILFLAVVAFYLNNAAAPAGSERVVYVEVTPTFNPQPTSTPIPLLVQAQTDLDHLKILRLVFGEAASYQFSDEDGQAEAKWVPAADSLGPFPANGARAYLTRVLQLTATDEGQSEQVIVFTQSAPDPALSVECQLVMGLAELRLEDGEWLSSGWQPALQPEADLCLLPSIESVPLGADVSGFVLHYDDTQKNVTRHIDQFYKPSPQGYQLILSLEAYRDNAAACPPGCYSTISDYEWLPAETDGVYDLQVTTRGTQLVEDEVVVVNEVNLYTFQDGVYQLVPTEEEVITE